MACAGTPRREMENSQCNWVSDFFFFFKILGSAKRHWPTNRQLRYGCLRLHSDLFVFLIDVIFCVHTCFPRLSAVLRPFRLEYQKIQHKRVRISCQRLRLICKVMFTKTKINRFSTIQSLGK